MFFTLLLTQGFSTVSAYTLEGSLKEIEKHYPVDSAVVTFTNSAGNQFVDTSDKKESGYFSIKNIPNEPSTGIITITGMGYRFFTTYITDVMSISYLSLVLIPTGKGTAKLTGTITDQSNHNAIEGVQVVLSLAPAVANFQSPYDTTFTDSNGAYQFDSLFPPSWVYPDQFSITVSKPSYGPQISYTELPAGRGTVNFQMVPVGNKIGTVKGKITSTQSQAAIANAKVILIRNTTLFGTTFRDSVTTDQLGDFTLDSIPASTGNQLSVYATGFASKNSQLFLIDSCGTVTMNMVLQTLSTSIRSVNATPQIIKPTGGIHLYGIDGRQISAFRNADYAKVINSLNSRHGICQPAILQWTENGVTRYRSVVVQN